MSLHILQRNFRVWIRSVIISTKISVQKKKSKTKLLDQIQQSSSQHISYIIIFV